MAIAAVGLALFAGVGFVAYVYGGNFLDYSALPLGGLEPAMRRYYGILFIEIGIFVAVAFTFISIFRSLSFCKEEV